MAKPNKVVFMPNVDPQYTSDSIVIGEEASKEEMNVYNQSPTAYISVKKEEHTMDDSTKVLLNRLDQDMRDHKQEIRDRDASILTDAKERENRYREELKAQDERWRQETKEREERILRAIEQGNESTEKRLAAIESEVSASVKHSQTMVTTNIVAAIATFIGVAALVITTIVALVQLIPK
ncbi:hypothetical protein [Paenibacillus sp. ACRRY]|uniref:hypothetical protein n=1 Tax=Paenibacillus sp. ACRRY TaxID=2918208 RepID=UPI001EF5F6AB|nr:hypothetical protein [Paenibacillus sp. ACRRY]MCG7385132.1 hypothetical protein [Paenibacillus sp. ACRRY]